MRRSKEQMYPIVAAYERGEVSKNDLCREQELREATFWYWVRKYRSEGESSFIELIDSGGSEDTQMEVLLGDGVVRFNVIPGADYLRELMIG